MSEFQYGIPVEVPFDERTDIMAPTILDDAVVVLSQEFACVEWLETPTEDGNAIAPNGDRYVTITTGGEKVEGDRTPGLFCTAEAAIADWLLHVREHARRRGAGPGATLYWRIKPEIDEQRIMRPWWRDGPGKAPGWYQEAVFVIYSRLLIVPMEG